MAERDAVYFTCIPALRKVSDSDLDGGRIRTRILWKGLAFGFLLPVTTFMVLSEDPIRLYLSVGDRGFSVESGRRQDL